MAKNVPILKNSKEKLEHFTNLCKALASAQIDDIQNLDFKFSSLKDIDTLKIPDVISPSQFKELLQILEKHLRDLKQEIGNEYSNLGVINFDAMSSIEPSNQIKRRQQNIQKNIIPNLQKLLQK